MNIFQVLNIIHNQQQDSKMNIKEQDEEIYCKEEISEDLNLIEYGIDNCREKMCKSSRKKVRIMEEEHNSKKYVGSVENCKASFNKRSILTNHKRSAHETPVKCPHDDCDSVIKPYHLPRHIKLVHKPIKQKCKNC